MTKDPLVGLHYTFLHKGRKYSGTVRARITTSTYLVSTKKGLHILGLREMMGLGFIFK